jgi:hypothetical protein
MCGVNLASNDSLLQRREPHPFLPVIPESTFMTSRFAPMVTASNEPMQAVARGGLRLGKKRVLPLE